MITVGSTPELEIQDSEGADLVSDGGEDRLAGNAFAQSTRRRDLLNQRIERFGIDLLDGLSVDPRCEFEQDLPMVEEAGFGLLCEKEDLQ